MNRKLLTGIVLVVVIVVGYAGYTRMAPPAAAPAPTPQPESSTENVIWASGKVLPARWADLSFSGGGRITRLLVKEGDQVEEGQLLAEVETTQLEQAVTEAEAALAVARANLDLARVGPRPEEIEAARQEAAVARQQVVDAEAAVDQARANLTLVRAGPTQQELDQAKISIDHAKDQLWGAQAQRDTICGQVGGAARQSNCDAAEAAVLQAQDVVYLAESQYAELKAGTRQEAIAVAQAAVDAAEKQVETAQAAATAAEAQVKVAELGPRPEEITVAEAQVKQAEAALERARVALQDARLVAPFDGIVSQVKARQGEIVGMSLGQAGGASLVVPVMTIGDLTHLRIETTDLRETDVAKIQVGQPVDVTFDALPGVRLSGKVTRIAPMATQGQGGTNYTVIVELDQQDPRLKWGMTAYVNITTAG
jgi:HlyD family secretion protein